MCNTFPKIQHEELLQGECKKIVEALRNNHGIIYSYSGIDWFGRAKYVALYRSTENDPMTPMQVVLLRSNKKSFKAFPLTLVGDKVCIGNLPVSDASIVGFDKDQTLAISTDARDVFSSSIEVLDKQNLIAEDITAVCSLKNFRRLWKKLRSDGHIGGGSGDFAITKNGYRTVYTITVDGYDEDDPEEWKFTFTFNKENSKHPELEFGIEFTCCEVDDGVDTHIKDEAMLIFNKYMRFI